ncbi:MAG TPA: hypothetical protein VMT68_13735 [Caulobacteraceae bacterium]|nr:hypothetical protein [Caulobacteraceae bacterium]
MSDDAEELVFETELDAPPEKVWRAIATPELREAWLGEPEAGPAEVVRAEPPGRLDLAWPTREGDSVVSFEIEVTEAGSLLTITHRALAPNVVALAPRRSRAGACGWRMAA